MESNSLTAMIATEHYMHMYDVEKIFFLGKYKRTFCVHQAMNISLLLSP